MMTCDVEESERKAQKSRTKFLGSRQKSNTKVNITVIPFNEN